GRKMTANYGTFIEGCADVFGQYSPMQGLHIASPNYFPEFYRYAQPDQILMLNSEGGHRDDRFPDISPTLFLLGIRDSNLIQKRILGVREAVKDVLYTSRFRSTKGLGPLPDKFEARVFESPTPGLFALPLVDRRAYSAQLVENPPGQFVDDYVADPTLLAQNQPVTVSLDSAIYPSLAQVAHAYWYSDEQPRVELPLERTGTEVSVKIPVTPAFVSCLILSRKAIGDLEIKLPTSVRPHDKARILVAGDGKPIAGARVFFGDTQATTGKDGIAAMAVGGYEGTYVVRAEASGFFSKRAFCPVHP
ncbi:MAG TPA: carboxypeptidase-like regulatory domain-containing protein, partial [Candidatus Methylacidiphilales bacterium]